MPSIRRWATRPLHVATCLVLFLFVLAVEAGHSQPPNPPPKETFDQMMARLKREKPALMRRHLEYLNSRYDLSKRTTNEVTMSRGKPLPVGPTAKLKGVTWEQLGELTPEQIRERGVFPYLPLPHVDHAAGGMVFPQPMIEKFPRLLRFDMDNDIPEHFLPEFPPAIFLSTRSDLGDVSKGEVVNVENFERLFKDILNEKQLDGLRLLVTRFPQQQFNMTEDRRFEKPSEGVACFDCHVNGHTNGAFHLVGDIRPQENRRRIETISLRGVHSQRLFGSQRALKTVEDFTEFEQRAAYFDGNLTDPARKGVNPLERGSQVHAMAEMQELLDFPPAPKLNLYGRLDPSKATPAETRGEALFFGKAKCSECHTAPLYSDNLMHDLKVERFYKPHREHGMMMTSQGPLKTTTLRGVKDSPPYLHDGRLLTLEDTVEFFNLIQGLKLNSTEKKDLVAFLRQL